ncbi:MAG: T9SS type A sorting domain-containing protein [Bacteroidia bacterium]
MKQLYIFILAVTLSLGSAFAGGDFLSSDSGSLIGDPFVAELRVWPNPSPSGNFQASFSLIEAEQPVRVRVYSLIGRMVFDRELKSNNGTIELDFSVKDYPRGIYMLEISRGKQRITRRLSFL